jgi:hypothetical protein
MKAGIAVSAPMVYTAPVRTVFDAFRSITGASGRGSGPGNLDFFGPQIITDRKFWAPNGICLSARVIYRAQKTLDFQGPTPSHLSS